MTLFKKILQVPFEFRENMEDLIAVGKSHMIMMKLTWVPSSLCLRIRNAEFKMDVPMKRKKKTRKN